MADVKVTDIQLVYNGSFSDSGFDTIANEMRFSYAPISDARFRKSSAIKLPEINEQGETVEGVISLSNEQVDEIKAIITRALSGVGFDPEFGPAG